MCRSTSITNDPGLDAALPRRRCLTVAQGVPPKRFSLLDRLLQRRAHFISEPGQTPPVGGCERAPAA